MEQAVKDKKAVAAKKRKDTRLRRERARLDEIAALANAKLDGIAQGEKIGVEKGRAEGITQGRAEGVLQTAKNMKAKGVDVNTIAEFTELTVNEIEKL